MLKLNELLDVSKLTEHLKNGTVGRQYHPTLPLVIYNYTHTAQFTPGIWGDDVIDYCRGLIVNTETQEVVSRPFKKFHNLNTPDISETQMENIVVHFVGKPPVVTEKMDGSLGVFWRLGDEWGIATRGSFTSPQAQWATAWYKAKVAEGVLKPFKGTHWTPLFEIIFKENQIVVSYDFEGLVLLGFVHKYDGFEAEDVAALGAEYGFTGDRLVKNYGKVEFGKKYAERLPKSESNREGYVLSFNRGYEPPLKVKVKFDEYCKLHKIVTGLNPRTLWEVLSKGADLEIRGQLPEQFQKWLKSWEDRFVKDYNHLYFASCNIYAGRPKATELDDVRSLRKKYALYFKQATGKLENPEIAAKVQPILFTMLNDNSAETNELIWDLIKPRGDDKSFRTDGE